MLHQHVNVTTATPNAQIFVSCYRLMIMFAIIIVITQGTYISKFHLWNPKEIEPVIVFVIIWSQKCWTWLELTENYRGALHKLARALNALQIETLDYDTRITLPSEIHYVVLDLADLAGSQTIIFNMNSNTVFNVFCTDSIYLTEMHTCSLSHEQIQAICQKCTQLSFDRSRLDSS